MDPALNNYLKAADMAYDIGEIHALTPDCAHYPHYFYTFFTNFLNFDP